MVSHRRSPHCLRVLLLSAALLAGCGGEPTGLQLKLVVDPQLNSEAQLLSVINTIQLVLDAPDGFSGTPAEGGELTARDVDRDGKPELVLTREVAGQRSFPLYRLLPGSNLDRAFYITARGLVGSEVAAIGGSALAQFTAGQNAEISVPLNLRPAYRAPRVVMSLPHDGQHAVPQALANVYLEFSKWIAGSTVEKNLRLINRNAAGEEREVPGKWQLTNIAVNELGFPEQRTAATFERDVGCYLPSGEYSLEAMPEITDASGNQLDQDALQPGATGFRSTFHVLGNMVQAGPVQGAACVAAPPEPGCLDTPECNLDGGSSFLCLKKDPSQPGICVPDGQSCGVCPKGYLCAPGADVKSGQPGAPEGAPSAACVPDCRVFVMAGCPVGMRCDFGSGLCKNCLTSSTTSGSSSGTGPVPVCNLPCPGTPGGCGPQTFCDPLKLVCVPCPPLAEACF